MIDVDAEDAIMDNSSVELLIGILDDVAVTSVDKALEPLNGLWYPFPGMKKHYKFEIGLIRDTMAECKRFTHTVPTYVKNGLKTDEIASIQNFASIGNIKQFGGAILLNGRNSCKFLYLLNFGTI